MSKHQIESLDVEMERADKGQGGRTSLARQNSQARVGTAGVFFFSLFSWPQAEDYQPYIG